MGEHIVGGPFARTRDPVQSPSRQICGQLRDGLRLLFELVQQLVDRERPVIHVEYVARLDLLCRRSLTCALEAGSVPPLSHSVPSAGHIVSFDFGIPTRHDFIRYPEFVHTVLTSRREDECCEPIDSKEPVK